MRGLLPVRRVNRCRLPWTPDDARRHAAAVAELHALLKRDRGFQAGRAEHREALRRVGAVTVSLDWYFFAASRAIREQARAVSA